MPVFRKVAGAEGGRDYAGSRVYLLPPVTTRFIRKAAPAPGAALGGQLSADFTMAPARAKFIWPA